MLNAIHISHVFVFDQDEALVFYVDKLGLEVSNDQDLGFMRWLTVRVPGQPGRDILLEKPGPPAIDEASARQVRELITKGASGFTIGFTTEDCRKTYQALLAKGVEFTQEPGWAAPASASFSIPLSRSSLPADRELTRGLRSAPLDQ
jgi:catechol 2,3-dioxygenase-like lactoylglutathione lyase family enzyme